MVFDHELKLRRAFKHLQDLDREVTAWVKSDCYSIRKEYKPETEWPFESPIADSGIHHLFTPWVQAGEEPPDADVRREPGEEGYGVGCLTFYATATKQPPTDPFGLLIGDTLHNLRSALDTLAFALAAAHTKPLT